MKYLIGALIFIISCSHKKELEDEKELSEIKLSNNSTNKFKEIFDGLILYGESFEVNNSYYLPQIKTHPIFVENNDLSNYSFFRLEEDSLTFIVILVDNRFCCASIVNEFHNYYYPSVDVIYPSDFTFLNFENKIPFLFDCINKDSQKFRNIEINPGLFGDWILDSILDSKGIHYFDSFKRMNVENDTIVTFDDFESYNYLVDGPIFEIKDSAHNFYKIFNNEDFLILINNYDNSYSEYYFHKDGNVSPAKQDINN